VRILARVIFSTAFLFRLLSLATLEAFLAVLGAIWLVTELVSYFAPSADTWIKSNVPLSVPLAFAAFVTLVARFPRTRFARKIAGTDICVEVAVADILLERGGLVVPSNTTFDTDIQGGIISSTSVQAGHSDLLSQRFGLA
jgi:hypothetical protein